ncbi:MAG: ZIP family metal transporter [Patescibacteria group bacterium]|jgi:zinc and cadmium transporter
MAVYFYIFGGVLLVSLLSLVGIFFLSLSKDVLNKITLFLVSLSAGTLLGGSFLHLLPEAFEKSGEGMSIWFFLLSGLMIFFVLEKLIHWRHCHIPTSSEHPHHLGVMNMVGDGLHNFFDGVVIATAFLINIPLGLTTLIAVIAHEIPQEIGDFGVLIYAGYSRRRAMLLNLLTALTSVLGALVAILFASKIGGFSDFIIPFTAGGFIYIATADLIPEIKKEPCLGKSLGQLVFIVMGIFIMLALKLILE